MAVPSSSRDDFGLYELTAFEGGFVAPVGARGLAMVSRDGTEWTAYDVMPRALGGAFESVIGLAAIGDRVMAITDPYDGSAAGAWSGSLSAMGLEPEP
jgi:hypothetical protein